MPTLNVAAVNLPSTGFAPSTTELSMRSTPAPFIPKPHQIRRQQGFTLVEIAIVLVIVGLLLGAVLKGQELIFNTKVKSTYNMSRETAAALYAYQDRYRVSPGDDNQATSRFPTANPAVTNGNGDGLIAYGSACQAAGVANAGENCNALHHMRVSGFISGSGNEGLRTAFGGLASPARWGKTSSHRRVTTRRWAMTAAGSPTRS